MQTTGTADGDVVAVGYQSSYTSFEVRHDIGGVTLLQRVGVHRGDCTGHFSPCDGLVTSHHQFLQHFSAWLQCHADGGSSLDSHFHSFVTQEGDEQYFVC